jgi:hypothetical protein
MYVRGRVECVGACVFVSKRVTGTTYVIQFQRTASPLNGQSRACFDCLWAASHEVGNG